MVERTKPFKWTVEFSVAPCWVADGFELTQERALDMLSHDLGWANITTELGAKIISGPDRDAIAKTQGYQDAKHMDGDGR